METSITQRDFAALIGVSEPAVSAMVKKGLLLPEQTAGAWLLAYCQNLREQAAGRSLELQQERAGLAKEQKLRARLKKLQDLGEWAPIENLTLVLSRVTSQMASLFDQIPVKLKRAYPDLTAEQLNIIRTELDAARNLLVSVGTDTVRDAAARLVDYIDEFDDGSTAYE